MYFSTGQCTKEMELGTAKKISQKHILKEGSDDTALERTENLITYLVKHVPLSL